MYVEVAIISGVDSAVQRDILKVINAQMSAVLIRSGQSYLRTLRQRTGAARGAVLIVESIKLQRGVGFDFHCAVLLHIDVNGCDANGKRPVLIFAAGIKRNQLAAVCHSEALAHLVEINGRGAVFSALHSQHAAGAHCRSARVKVYMNIAGNGQRISQKDILFTCVTDIPVNRGFRLRLIQKTAQLCHIGCRFMFRIPNRILILRVAGIHMNFLRHVSCGHFHSEVDPRGRGRLIQRAERDRNFQPACFAVHFGRGVDRLLPMAVSVIISGLRLHSLVCIALALKRLELHVEDVIICIIVFRTVEMELEAHIGAQMILPLAGVVGILALGVAVDIAYPLGGVFFGGAGQIRRISAHAPVDLPGDYHFVRGALAVVHYNNQLLQSQNVAVGVHPLDIVGGFARHNFTFAVCDRNIVFHRDVVGAFHLHKLLWVCRIGCGFSRGADHILSRLGIRLHNGYSRDIGGISRVGLGLDGILARNIVGKFQMIAVGNLHGKLAVGHRRAFRPLGFHSQIIDNRGFGQIIGPAAE